MKNTTQKDIKKIVLRQLRGYRKTRELLIERRLSGHERTEATYWVHAIESARRALKAEFPLRDRAMNRLFGFDHPIPRREPVHDRIVQLSLAYGVGESTFYKWRERLVQLTTLAAIEAGLLKPFGVVTAANAELTEGGNDDKMPT